MADRNLTLNTCFRRLLIRDLLMEVRILNRINPVLAMRAERDLIALG